MSDDQPFRLRILQPPSKYITMDTPYISSDMLAKLILLDASIRYPDWTWVALSTMVEVTRRFYVIFYVVSPGGIHESKRLPDRDPETGMVIDVHLAKDVVTSNIEVNVHKVIWGHPNKIHKDVL